MIKQVIMELKELESIHNQLQNIKSPLQNVRVLLQFKNKEQDPKTIIGEAEKLILKAIDDIHDISNSLK